MSDVAEQTKLYDMHDAIAYFEKLGFKAVTKGTIQYHLYNTEKLSKPKRLGKNGPGLWTQDQLDALIEAL